MILGCHEQRQVSDFLQQGALFVRAFLGHDYVHGIVITSLYKTSI